MIQSRWSDKVGQSVVSSRQVLLGPKTGSRGLSLRGRIGKLELTKAISSQDSREGLLSSTSC